MSLAQNLSALGRLLTAGVTGVVTGKSPAAGDNSKALATTEWFKAEQATEAVQGTAKAATQGQTNAGTDDATMVTPKKLRFGFAASLAPNGYIIFPTWLGSLIIQWGSGTCIKNSGIWNAFPMAFPTACYAITTGYNASGNSPNVQTVGIINVGVTGFLGISMDTSGASVTEPLFYIAFGR
jgi:hypothetical protein